MRAWPCGNGLRQAGDLVRAPSGFGLPAFLGPVGRLVGSARVVGLGIGIGSADFVPVSLLHSSPSLCTPGQPDADVVTFAVAAVAQRHPPTLGKNAQHVLEAVGRVDRPAAEADDLVAVAQAAAIGVGRFEDVADHDAAVARRRPTTAPSVAWSTIRPLVEDAEEVLDLVDRDRRSPRRRSPGPRFSNEPRPLMPISRPRASNSGPPELPGLIEASVCRQSVYSSSVPAGILVAVHAGDDAVGHGRLEIGGQQERIAHGEHPIAARSTVAVAQFGGRGNRRGRRA